MEDVDGVPVELASKCIIVKEMWFPPNVPSPIKLKTARKSRYCNHIMHRYLQSIYNSIVTFQSCYSGGAQFASSGGVCTGVSIRRGKTLFLQAYYELSYI